VLPHCPLIDNVPVLRVYVRSFRANTSIISSFDEIFFCCILRHPLLPRFILRGRSHCEIREKVPASDSLQANEPSQIGTKKELFLRLKGHVNQIQSQSSSQSQYYDSSSIVPPPPRHHPTRIPNQLQPTLPMAATTLLPPLPPIPSL